MIDEIKWKSIFASIVLAVLCSFLATACGDDDDDDDSGSPDSDDDADDDAADDDASDDDSDDDADDDHGYPEPYDPTAWGPYQVGNRTMLFTDEDRGDLASRGPRKLLTEVWYPAADSAADLPRDRVSNFLGNWAGFIKRVLGWVLPDEEIANFDATTLSARDAPIHTGGGPYPVVLVSHGNAAIRFAYHSLCEYLASHGYIVVAPDHIGNAVFVTLPERLVIFNPLLMPTDAVDRVEDMWFLLDTFTDLNEDDPEDFFTGLVDVSKAGVIGHSFGGVTGTEYAILDGRVSAAIDMAAYMIPIFPESYHAALMFLTGSEDRTLGDAEWAWRAGYMISPAPKYFMELWDAGHYTFSDACSLIPTLMGHGDGCGSQTRRDTGEPFDFIDIDYAHEIIYGYAAAFFGLHLKGQQAMGPYLFANRYPDDMEYRWKYAPPE